MGFALNAGLVTIKLTTCAMLVTLVARRALTSPIASHVLMGITGR